MAGPPGTLFAGELLSTKEAGASARARRSCSSTALRYWRLIKTTGGRSGR